MTLFDSNRQGHLFAAGVAALGTLGCSFVLATPPLVATSACIFAWELTCTPDMDHDSRRAWGPWYRRLWVFYWRPYAKLVRHRSKWSHSLAFGLPARLMAGPGLWLGVALLFLPADWSTALTGLIAVWWPWVLLGVVVGDVMHLLKDGYKTPNHIIFGR